MAPIALFVIIAVLVMVLDRSKEEHRVTSRNIKTRPKADARGLTAHSTTEGAGPTAHSVRAGPAPSACV